MITLIVIVPNECGDLRFEIARQEVVFQQDAVLEGLVPSIARKAIARQSAERGDDQGTGSWREDS